MIQFFIIQTNWTNKYRVVAERRENIRRHYNQILTNNVDPNVKRDEEKDTDLPTYFWNAQPVGFRIF